MAMSTVVRMRPRKLQPRGEQLMLMDIAAPESPAPAASRLFAHTDEDSPGWRYVAARLGLPYQKQTWVIGREINGQIAGAWAYQNFTALSCQIHFAATDPRWLNKDLLWKAFHVPFEQWGLLTLIGIISASNDTSLEIARRLGFEIFATLPDAHPDGDLVFHRMHRSKCRWLDMPRRKSWVA